MTTLAHFILIKANDFLNKLTQLHVEVMVKLHGRPIFMVSDQDFRFISHFLRSLQKALGMKLYFSTAFYPQTNIQYIQTIQTLEGPEIIQQMMDKVVVIRRNLKAA